MEISESLLVRLITALGGILPSARWHTGCLSWVPGSIKITPDEKLGEDFLIIEMDHDRDPDGDKDDYVKMTAYARKREDDLWLVTYVELTRWFQNSFLKTHYCPVLYTDDTGTCAAGLVVLSTTKPFRWETERWRKGEFNIKKKGGK